MGWGRQARGPQGAESAPLESYPGDTPHPEESAGAVGNLLGQSAPHEERIAGLLGLHQKGD